MNIKTLSAIAILSVSLAGPAFAQHAGVNGTNDEGAASSLHRYRRVYNQAPVNERIYGVPPVRDNGSLDSYGRDPSRIGGEDPDLRPSGS